MKKKFLEVWKGVEKEGPSEWWKNQPEGGRKQRGGNLKAGRDATGDFDVVQGGTVSAGGLGYVLDAGGGEAFAVQKLAQPVQESATFRLRYRAATKSNTRNACFCFGAQPENDHLFKAGTMIGMDRHGAFDGAWANVNLGAGKKVQLERDATFEAVVTIDLEHGKVILKTGDTRIEHQLPSSLESVAYVGIYAKGTKSEFSKIERVRD
jgi:arylsulfatase A